MYKCESCGPRHAGSKWLTEGDMKKAPYEFSTERIEAIKRFCLKTAKWRWDVYEKNLVRYKVLLDESSSADASQEDLAECEINITGSQACCHVFS